MSGEGNNRVVAYKYGKVVVCGGYTDNINISNQEMLASNMPRCYPDSCRFPVFNSTYNPASLYILHNKLLVADGGPLIRANFGFAYFTD